MMSMIVYQELRVYKDSYYNGSEGAKVDGGSTGMVLLQVE